MSGALSVRERVEVARSMPDAPSVRVSVPPEVMVRLLPGLVSRIPPRLVPLPTETVLDVATELSQRATSGLPGSWLAVQLASESSAAELSALIAVPGVVVMEANGDGGDSPALFEAVMT